MYEVTEAGPKEKKLKLSESFSFDLNDESIALMTGEQVRFGLIESWCCCRFSPVYCNSGAERHG